MENYIGKKIRELRLNLNLTLEEVANFVGVGKSTVAKWESGRIANMKRDKIASLSKVLKVSPTYLMGWENEKQSTSTQRNNYTDAEKSLINNYRELNHNGQEYIKDQMNFAKSQDKYKKLPANYLYQEELA